MARKNALPATRSNRRRPSSVDCWPKSGLFVSLMIADCHMQMQTLGRFDGVARALRVTSAKSNDVDFFGKLFRSVFFVTPAHGPRAPDAKTSSLSIVNVGRFTRSEDPRLRVGPTLAHKFSPALCTLQESYHDPGMEMEHS